MAAIDGDNRFLGLRLVSVVERIAVTALCMAAAIALAVVPAPAALTAACQRPWAIAQRALAHGRTILPTDKHLQSTLWLLAGGAAPSSLCLRTFAYALRVCIFLCSTMRLSRKHNILPGTRPVQV